LFALYSGVLVAVSIPIFTSQLEKSREATDAADIRDAYAVIQSAALTEDSGTELAKNNNKNVTYTSTGTSGTDLVYKAEVTLTQKQDQWQTGDQNIGGIELKANTAVAGGTATVTYTQSTGATTITIA
jgi:type IV pilus assembly protein PilA